MKAKIVVVVLGLVACRPAGTEGATDAAPVPRDAAAAATDAAASEDSATGTGTDAGADAGARAEGEGELTLEVHGGNCPPDRQLAPGCRSYTLVLRADGSLRGGRRKTPVPADETEATLRLASEAFATKPTCIPNAPDRGGQAITFRVRDVSQTARGGCGPRLEALRARLEKLAAAD